MSLCDNDAYHNCLYKYFIPTGLSHLGHDILDKNYPLKLEVPLGTQ